MKWVTRSHVHVDRVASLWLIKRFIDSKADFIFVPRSMVKLIAEQEKGVPFDAPGVELGHHEGKCTFEAILRKHELTDAALERMATIIRASATHSLDSDKLAHGFEAIAAGFSLRFPNDTENIEHQFEVYDALYAWCCLEVAKGTA